MRRLIVCVVVSLAVILGVVTVGFSRLAVAEDKMRLNYWSLMNASDKEVMDEMIAEFNRTHTDVEVYSSVASFDNYYQQLNRRDGSRERS